VVYVRLLNSANNRVGNIRQVVDGKEVSTSKNKHCYIKLDKTKTTFRWIKTLYH